MGREGSQRSHLRNRVSIQSCPGSRREITWNNRVGNSLYEQTTKICRLAIVSLIRKARLNPNSRAFLYQIHSRRHLAKVCANTK